MEGRIDREGREEETRKVRSEEKERKRERKRGNESKVSQKDWEERLTENIGACKTDLLD